jgi:hypothetical protein
VVSVLCFPMDKMILQVHNTLVARPDRFHELVDGKRLIEETLILEGSSSYDPRFPEVENFFSISIFGFEG